MKNTLVISDTHGRKDEIISLIEKLHNEIDYVLHLGDVTSDIDKCIQIFKDLNFICVSGNCDFYDGQKTPNEKLITINNKKIFMTHGDIYNVKSGIDRLLYKSIELKADVCLFGHSHYPFLIEEENILFMNPGSLTFPRGISYKSYGLLNFDTKIKAIITGVSKTDTKILFSN